MRFFQHWSQRVERTHYEEAYRRKTLQLRPVQLCLRFFRSIAESHEKAQWTETFQLQPMQCNFQMEQVSFEARQNSHCSRLIRVALFAF